MVLKRSKGIFLVVQWLKLLESTAGSVGSIPVCYREWPKNK